MTIDPDTFSQWCILEIMGHNRFAGLVSEISIGGASFIRIDIPDTKRQAGFTKIFGASSVYCITPVAEDVARALAAKLEHAPVVAWDLPQDWREKIRQPALAHEVHDQGYVEDDG